MLSARAFDVDEEQRNLGIARDQGAMRAAADVIPAAEVGELVALGRRDEDLAGVRVRECRPGAGERVGMVEDRGVAGEREQATSSRREVELLSVAPRDGAGPFAEQRHLGGLHAVEAGRDLPRLEGTPGWR